MAMFNDDEVHQTSKQGENWRTSSQVRIEEDLREETWQARYCALLVFGLEVLLRQITSDALQFFSLFLQLRID